MSSAKQHFGLDQEYAIAPAQLQRPRAQTFVQGCSLIEDVVFLQKSTRRFFFPNDNLRKNVRFRSLELVVCCL